MKLSKRLRKLFWPIIAPILGAYDYFCRRKALAAEGGPFNRQTERATIFRDLVAAIAPEAIVETGTFRGKTTRFMRETADVPVFTVEIEPRFYVYNALQFRGDDKIRTHFGDSRSFLKRLAANTEALGRSPFFYLDAHWLKDLPLREEIEIVLAHWPDAVIMIDDFAVPDDAGYGYDDYGPGKALTLDYIAGIPDIAKFFPAAPSSRETGAKRGAIVIAREAAAIARLRQVPSLREYA